MCKVKITVELPQDAATKLMGAWERQDRALLESLKDFNVVSISEMPRKDIQGVLSIQTSQADTNYPPAGEKGL